MPKYPKRPSTADEIRIAKQAAILEVDERFAGRWVTSMRQIVAQDLPEEDFTRARMAALSRWQRDRNLEQSRLNYRYDLGRRNHALVSRDTEAQIEALRKKIHALNTRFQLKAQASDDAS